MYPWWRGRGFELVVTKGVMMCTLGGGGEKSWYKESNIVYPRGRGLELLQRE